MTTYFSVLSERTVAEKPFRKFMAMAVRAGELGYKWLDCPRMRTDVARDAICTEFRRLSSDPDDILIMCDNDHLDDPTLLEQLVADDKPVVAALAFRGDPTKPDPCFWTRDSNGLLRTPRTWERGLVKATIVGTGAIAIKRSVFTALDNAGYNLMNFFYQYNPQGESMVRVSDEVGFSQMLEELKIETYVDTRLVIPHCADAQIDESSWVEWCADHPLEKREHMVSVIIPQRGRLLKLKKAIDSLLATAPEVECIVMADADDTESNEFFRNTYHQDERVRWCSGFINRPIDKWNEGARLATGDVLMVAANDVSFEENWMSYALDALDSLPDACGVVSVNDGHTTPEVSSPHFLMSRDFAVKYNGGVLMPPCYEMMFPDVEVRHRAQSLGRYATAKMSRVIHDHPLTGSAEIDSIHREGYLKSFDRDRALFLERQKQDFPLTWDAILK